jgi:cysteine desulfurase
MDIKKLRVDLVSISGHKIYGPKGVGALFVKKGVLIKPIQFGGHQESGLRPGTYNVAGIVGLGKAVELIKKNKSVNKKIRKLRDKLIKEILKKIPDTQINGDLKNRVPANANFCFKGVEGESILLMLDFEGIAVSTGSACSSGSLEPSHVLMAMGIPPELAHGSIRITLGKNNTLSEIDKVLEILPKIITKLRKISPFH